MAAARPAAARGVAEHEIGLSSRCVLKWELHARSAGEAVKRITRQFCGNLFAILSPIGFEWEEEEEDGHNWGPRPEPQNDEQHGQEERKGESEVVHYP